MKKGTSHPSTEIYQNFIVNSCLALMESKHINNITITELCERAQISRRTFYRHFDSKEAIVTFYIDSLMKSLANKLYPSIQEDNFRTFAFTFFHFFYSLQAQVQAIQNSGLGDQLFTGYLQCILPILHSPANHMFASASPDATYQDVDCKIAYQMGGIWSLLMHWMSHGCIQTPMQLADLIQA